MLYGQVILIFAIFISYSFCQSEESPLLLSLNNDSWSFHMANNSTKYHNASVPGGIYTDLTKAGVLTEDILFESNDVKYRWVGKKDWIYSIKFDVPQSYLMRKNVYLVFHGLDTIGEIKLNGKMLGKVNNMFVRYRYDVKSILKEKLNELEVKLLSPINEADRLSRESKYEVLPNCPRTEQQGECHINFLRKMQASFSWDWGPAFPSVGIWKSVELEAYDTVRIRSVSITTTKVMDTWEISSTIYMESEPNKSYKSRIEFELFAVPSPSADDQKRRPVKIKFIPVDIAIHTDANGEGHVTISEIYINEAWIATWWPNGYGSQRLYDLDMTLITEKETNKTSTRFGFRTVKLVEDEVDCHHPLKGRSFYFEVNGIKIFAKGSNLVPVHILPEKSTDWERVKNLLYSAKDVSMNMIRVWGGGVYESDEFYELCDKLGLMVWQDMMFSCSMYPATEEFLHSVSKEIVQNVRRLQRHPSIILWTGNNENEKALAQNWYGTSKNFEMYKRDYVKLYVDHIKPLIEANDRSRKFLLSSPTNGAKSVEENFVSFTQSGRYGDVHEFNYYDKWDPSSTKPNRFCSEFGIQSLPSYSTLAQATKKENLNATLNSEFFKSRQHHHNGYHEMKTEIDMNLDNGRFKDLETLIYYSQINQAMSIKTMTEVYRRARDNLAEDGSGMTMGALYWQLNDVWQAPSWSSIEYGGKWKMLHYFAKAFFAPVIISPYVKEGTLKVMLVSDKRFGPPLRATLKTTVYRWDSLAPINEDVVKIKLNPLSSLQVISQPLIDFLNYTSTENKGCGKTKNEAERNCFVVFKLMEKITLAAPEAFLFPTKLHEISGLQKSNIELTGLKAMDIQNKNPFLPKETKKYEFTFKTDNIALFVWLDVGAIDGRFYENGFLFNSKEKTVNFLGFKPVTVCQLQNALIVQTISGTFTIAESLKKKCDEENMVADESHKSEETHATSEDPSKKGATKSNNNEEKSSQMPTQTGETKNTEVSKTDPKVEDKSENKGENKAENKEENKEENKGENKVENKGDNKVENKEENNQKPVPDHKKSSGQQVQFVWYTLLLPIVFLLVCDL